VRIALISDIHGNSIALDAVLAHIDGNVDKYLFLGDYAAIGFDPAGVLERVTALPNASFIRGNTDRYIITGDRPSPRADKVLENPDLLPIVMAVHAEFVWAQGYLAATGWLEWLAELPLEHRLTLPNGARLLAVHAAPGRDDGDGFHTDMSDEEITAMAQGCGADIVTVGHYHQPMERIVEDIHCINVASISNPQPGDRRAKYVTIDANADGYAVHFHRVEYDYQAVIDALYRVRHPVADYIAAFWNSG
jgi:predicted phosphodiesterase